MKTAKPYILMGNYENMGEAFRILEEQNIAYVLDERYAGKMINNKIPVIGYKGLEKFADSHLFVNMTTQRGGAVYAK